MMNKFIITILFVIGGVMFTLPKLSQAAVLYTGSANQVVYMDETFLVEWYLDTQGQPINTMDLALTYSTDNLEVVDLNVGGSVVDFWVEAPQFDNAQGRIELTGGMAGVSDSKLPVIKATLRPLKPGSAKISLDPKSEVLIADGQGTSAVLTFSEVNFVVNPAAAKQGRIKSQTHPDSAVWYKDRSVELVVETKPEEEYSYSFSSNIEIFPDQNPEQIDGPLTYNDLPDGIYYFKLNSRQKDTANNWQEAAVYRVMIDATPPDEFTPAIAKDEAVFEGQPFVSFVTTDSASGVAYYEVRANFLDGWKRTNDNYFKLPGLVLGDTIDVKVVDEAGNVRITQVEVDKNLVSPYFYNPIFWGIILILIGIVTLLVRTYFNLYKKHKVNAQ
jgi:hypothetical protein